MTTSPTLARKAKLKTHLVSAKAKLKTHVTPRRVVLLAAAACSVLLILSTLRTLHSASRRAATTPTAATAASTPAAVTHHAQQQQQDEEREKRDCDGKPAVPAPVAEALVHYATSGETPRQTEAEAGAAARVLARRAPCNLLVFGLGQASALWAALNHGGRTLFLETDADRIAAARAAHPAGVDDLEAHPVAYHNERAAATVSDDLLLLRNSSDCASPPTKPLSPDDVERSACPLAPRGLPAVFYGAEWDVIVVDGAPSPGAVYTAGVVARARRPGAGETTDVLVHGVDGATEEAFTRAFLCEGYIKEEAGRLRHFAIPSHRDKEAMPFCP
jgi:glucuronoxylan 4-O-methyltransferase